MNISKGTNICGQNYAVDAETGMLYYTVQNVAYRIALAGGKEPEAVAVFPGEPGAFAAGILADEKYVVQTEAGALYSCNSRKTMNVIRLTTKDLTGNDLITTAAARFNLEHPGFLMLVQQIDSEEETDPTDADL